MTNIGLAVGNIRGYKGRE